MENQLNPQVNQTVNQSPSQNSSENFPKNPVSSSMPSQPPISPSHSSFIPPAPVMPKSPVNAPASPKVTSSHYAIWIILAILVIGGVGYYVFHSYNNAQPKVTDLTPAKGTLIPEIPLALFIDPNVQIISSGKTLDQASNMDSLVALGNSAMSVSALKKGYDAYLVANGWTVLHQTSDTTSFYYLAADTAGKTLNLNVSLLPNIVSSIDIRITQPHVQ